ncbi:hypothetical protein ACVW00_002204 [Marmoricola sp. URHA0025 HA25]
MSQTHRALRRTRWSADQWCRAQQGAVLLVFVAAAVLAVSRFAALL